MTTSPCSGCRMKNEDKNNSTCAKCEERIRYVAHLERSLDYPSAAGAEDQARIFHAAGGF